MDPAAEAQILAMAEAMERAVDDELDKIDQMDDEDMDQIRLRRVKQLREMQKRKDNWLAMGHGRLIEVTDPAMFFDMVKKSERCIVTFKRPVTERCAIIDEHLKKIALSHFETRFMSIDVEKVPSLPQRFNVAMLPTIMLVEKGNTFHSIIGFDDFGGRDDFETETMEKVFMHYGMINDKDMFDNDQTNDDDE
jgi:hypothetical protein